MQTQREHDMYIRLFHCFIQTLSTSRDSDGLLSHCELVEEMLQDLGSLFSQQLGEGGHKVGRVALQLAVGTVKEQANTLKSEVSEWGVNAYSIFKLMLHLHCYKATSSDDGSCLWCPCGPVSFTGLASGGCTER